MPLQGQFRDRLVTLDGTPDWTPWRSNLVLWSGLDLIGALLCNGAIGITHLAVGGGDPKWDANAPIVDRSRRRLTNEVLRVAVQPGTAMTYDAATARIRVAVTIPPGEATGTLREVGLFGGHASSRPGSGVLLNHAIHPKLEKLAGDALDRELVLTIDGAWLEPGMKAVIGGLLTRAPGLSGITRLAIGTTGAAPAGPGLAAEVLRKAPDVTYDAASHTVTARALFEIGEGPEQVLETGLFAGTADDAPGSGTLVARDAGAPILRYDPKRLDRRMSLVLVSRTDIVVPAVTSKPIADARAALLGAQLQAGDIVEREEASPPGIVLEQRVAAGAVVNEATPIGLVVSTPVTAVVAQTLGLTVDQARAALTAAGFTPVDGPQLQSPLATGTVLASSPSGGTRAPLSSAVALTVAVPVRVPVPSVLAQTPGAAATIAERAGLRLAPAPYATQESNATAGTILAQDPVPGTSAVVGTAVVPTLASPKTILVPDLRTKTPTEASAMLTAAGAALAAELGSATGRPGLALGALSEVVDPAPAGTIVAHDPAAGARAFLYATVDVSISAAEVQTVPQLIGLAESEARAALTRADLTAAPHVLQRQSSAKVGTVSEQSPAAGVRWPAHSAVTFTVAAGRTVTMPDVLRASVDAARETLGDLGFATLTTSTREGGGAAGSVLESTPPPYESVAFGSDVALVLCSGVPDLIGRFRDDAVEAIGLALLAADVHTVEAPGSPGIVVSQAPDPGTAVDPGSSVRIDISIPVKVELPKFQDKAEAVRLLAALSLTGDWRTQESPLAIDTILDQDPVPGTRVDRNTIVTLTVAVAQTFPVPQLVYLTSDAAQAALAAVGLVLVVGGELSVPSMTPGTVFAQSPSTGERVVKGAPVTVTLVRRDPIFTVPNVIGMQEAWAKSALSSASFVMSRVGALADATAPGTVLSQSPLAATTTTIAGTTVQVWVSLGQVTRLDFYFDTGGDDLRGGNDNLTIRINYGGGRTKTATNVNNGAAWDNYTSHSVTIVLDGAGILPEAIASIDLITRGAGDNWDMNRVRVYAIGVGINTLITWSDYFRFTGDNPALNLTPKRA